MPSGHAININNGIIIVIDMIMLFPNIMIIFIIYQSTNSN